MRCYVETDASNVKVLQIPVIIVSYELPYIVLKCDPDKQKGLKMLFLQGLFLIWYFQNGLWLRLFLALYNLILVYFVLDISNSRTHQYYYS